MSMHFLYLFWADSFQANEKEFIEEEITLGWRKDIKMGHK